MKTLPILCLVGLTPASLLAASVIDSTTFYEPNFKVRREGGTSGLLSLSVTNTPVSGSLGAGDVVWTHSAGGHAQVRTDAEVLGSTVANLDAQLAATTQTIGNSLVFGREITATATLLDLPVAGQEDALNDLVNQLVGASVTYNWNAASTVSNLTIEANTIYQVNFTVTTGAGLPVGLLESSTFGITTTGVTGASNESANSLDLLGLVAIGSASDTGVFSFQFKSENALSQLDFNFAAASVVDVMALGGADENQNVLTFTDFEVVQIPEPSTWVMGILSVGLLGVRRRR